MDFSDLNIYSNGIQINDTKYFQVGEIRHLDCMLRTVTEYIKDKLNKLSYQWYHTYRGKACLLLYLLMQVQFGHSQIISSVKHVFSLFVSGETRVPCVFYYVMGSAQGNYSNWCQSYASIVALPA